jgi:hypothetical protein
VNDLAGDIQCQLKEKCIDFVAYSVATVESTDVTDMRSLLFVFKVSMRTFNL